VLFDGDNVIVPGTPAKRVGQVEPIASFSRSRDIMATPISSRYEAILQALKTSHRSPSPIGRCARAGGEPDTDVVITCLLIFGYPEREARRTPGGWPASMFERSQRADRGGFAYGLEQGRNQTVLFTTRGAHSTSHDRVKDASSA